MDGDQRIWNLSIDHPKSRLCLSHVFGMYELFTHLLPEVPIGDNIQFFLHFQPYLE